MSMSALSHILAVEYSYAVRTEIFSFPFLDSMSLTLSFVLPCNYWTSPLMILSDSWRFLLLSKFSVIFFNDVVPLSLRTASTNAGIALTTLSTIVIFAALDVLDKGLRSIVITLLFIFINASVLSKMLTSIAAPATPASSTAVFGHRAAVLPFTDMTGRLESNIVAAAASMARWAVFVVRSPIR